MHGAKIYLDFPSVGATENIMMASYGADGETVIENATAGTTCIGGVEYIRHGYDNITEKLKKLGTNIYDG